MLSREWLAWSRRPPDLTLGADSLPSLQEFVARPGITQESICLDGGLDVNHWGSLAFWPLCPAALGRVLQVVPWVPEGRGDLLVFPAEVLVQEPIDDGIKAAVEISQEVASDKEALWDPGSHF